MGGAPSGGAARDEIYVPPEHPIPPEPQFRGACLIAPFTTTSRTRPSASRRSCPRLGRASSSPTPWCPFLPVVSCMCQQSAHDLRGSLQEAQALQAEMHTEATHNTSSSPREVHLPVLTLRWPRFWPAATCLSPPRCCIFLQIRLPSRRLSSASHTRLTFALPAL